MRFAYADPPYPGQSAKHYADHPDFAGEVERLRTALTEIGDKIEAASYHRNYRAACIDIADFLRDALLQPSPVPAEGARE